MADEARETGVDSGKKLNELKGFRIPSLHPNGSPRMSWTRGKHNLSGFQRLGASEPEALRQRLERQDGHPPLEEIKSA
jgi:hypothetical protein